MPDLRRRASGGGASERASERASLKGSLVTGLSLAGIGVLVVVVLRLLSDVWPAPGLPNILIGLTAVAYAAIFVGIMILLVGVLSHVFGASRLRPGAPGPLVKKF